ncbi:MFS transporter [Pseudomonas sp. NPDC089407]|uniref:MFS transporter n=1 Tax=Pseudomonas sp. NPDC089407 TaxID=3364464 RepID=UPI00384B6034
MRVFSRNHGTRPLALGYAFSKCGEFAFEAAFAVAIVSMTDADLFMIGIAYFFRYLPSLIFSPLGGWLADNADKRLILFAVEVLKAVLALACFASFSLLSPAFSVLVGLSMLMTALDCVYAPTFRAYFPDLVEKHELASINSTLQVIEDAASIVGPLVFSAFVLILSRETTFLFFALCLVLSGISLLTLAPASKGRRLAFNGRVMVRDTVHSVSQLRFSNAPLFAVIGCTTLCAMFATSVIRFILPASLLEHFDAEAAVGYVFSLLAAGTVLGGVFYTRFNPRTSARLVLRYWLLYGALFFAAAVALQFNPWLFLLMLLLVGFIGAFVDIAIVTNIQCLSSEHEVGRNFSLYYFTAVIGDAVSGLIASLVFMLAGPATFVWMTFMLFIAPIRWNLKDVAVQPPLDQEGKD